MDEKQFKELIKVLRDLEKMIGVGFTLVFIAILCVGGC